MERVVKVTRRGQTTIPLQIRERHRIREGTRLLVEDRGEEIVMRPVPDLIDLAGSLSKFATLKQANAILDEMERDED